MAYKFSSNGNGIPLWETKLGNEEIEIEGMRRPGISIQTSTPALSRSQERLYAAVGSTMNAIDTRTGDLIWSYKPEGVMGVFEASPVVDDQDNVYVGTKANEDSALYAFRADGKGLLWEKKVGADLYCSPSLGEGNVIYIGSEYTGNTGTFHAIYMKTGEYKWNINIMFGLEDFQKTSPIIHDGYAYIGSMQKSIFGPMLKIKIDSRGYLPDAGWPRFHGNSANNGRVN